MVVYIYTFKIYIYYIIDRSFQMLAIQNCRRSFGISSIQIHVLSVLHGLDEFKVY